MYKFRNLFFAAAVLFGGLFAWSCNPIDLPGEEENPSEEDSRTYPSRPITVTVGGVMQGDKFPETKSQVDIDDSAVSQVALFLFDAQSGLILLRPDGTPYTTVQNSNTFAFDLPYNPDGDINVDVYTICNYGNMSLPTSNINLSESELDALTYTINSIGELTAMPMAGKTSKVITPTTTGLKLSVDKLFAVYYINFDLSAVRQAGYYIDALYLTTHSVNRTVHWIRPEGGDAASTVNSILDYANSQELRLMADGAQAYVYVLENMQGTIPGASSWRTVQDDLGSAVAKCTYVDLGVKVHRSDNSWQNVYYQIYLGNGDMTSEFDIPRNYKKNISIKIPADGIGPSPTYPVFSWGEKYVYIEPGGSYRLAFSYQNIAPNDVRITSEGDCITLSGITKSDGTGSVLITADDDLTETSYASVFGSDSGGNTQDDAYVEVYIPNYSVAWGQSSVTLAPGESKTVYLYYTDLAYYEVDLSSSSSLVSVPRHPDPTTTIGKGEVTVSASGSINENMTVTVTAGYTNGGGGSADLTVNVVKPDEVTYVTEYVLDPDDASISVGDTQSYTFKSVTYTYVNGVLQPGVETTEYPSSQFNWNSSRPGVATVSGGVATGVSKGSTTITATHKTDHSMTASASLSVSSVPVVVDRWEIDPEVTTLAKGESVTYTIKHFEDTYLDGVLIEEDTEGVVVSNSQFSWSSSSTSVATVSAGTATVVTDDETASVTISASKAGVPTLTATINVSNDIEHTYEYDFWVSPESQTIGNGSTAQFTATFRTTKHTIINGQESGSPQVTDDDVTEMANWDIVEGDCVSNSGFGAFAFVSGGGTATIKAQFNDYSDTATITTVADVITYRYEYSLDVTPDEAQTLPEGESVSFTATYITLRYTIVNGVETTDPPVETSEDVSNAATWSITSGNLYVNNDGNGVFSWKKGSGSATVKATYEGKYDTGSIITLAHEVVITFENEYELSVSPDSATIGEGESAAFTATYITYEYRCEDGVRVGDPTVTSQDVTNSNGCSWTIQSGSSYVNNLGVGNYSWKNGPGSASIMATYEGKSDTALITTDEPDPDPYEVHEYELVVSPSSAHVDEGESASFTATYYDRVYMYLNGERMNDTPVSTTQTNVTNDADWSADNACVTLGRNGVFTWASGNGSATITATYSGISGTATITTGAHVPVEGWDYEYDFEVSPSSASIAEGESASFSAVYYVYAYPTVDGERTGVSPTVTSTDVTDDATWSVVSGSQYVSNDGNGVFSWVDGSGSATITAEYNDYSDFATITTDAHIPVPGWDYEYKLEVSPASVTIGEGESASFSATYYTYAYSTLDGVRTSADPTVTTENVTDEANWSVESGSQYVSDNGNGEFSWSDGPGSAVISAEYNNYSDSAIIYTEALPTTYEYEYSISPDSSEVSVGETQGYTISENKYTVIGGVRQGNPETNIANNGDFDWSSSDDDVASVSNGNATGVDSGSVTITAEGNDPNGNDISLSASLSVYHIFNFEGSGSTIEIHPGETVSLGYSTTLNESDVDAWVISGPLSARHSSNGVISVTCDSSASNGDSGSVGGGNSTKSATDSQDFEIVKDPVPGWDYEYSLEVSPSFTTLEKDETASFSATYYTYAYPTIDGVRTGADPTVTSEDVTDDASWSVVSGSQYISIEGNGVFGWASAPGSSTIQATYQGKNDTAVIETLEYIEITYALTVQANSNTTVMVGESISLSAILTEYHNGSVYSSTDVTSDCDWSSDGGSDVSVSDGIVTSSEYGHFEVTGTYTINGQQYDDSVNVTFIGYVYIELSHDLSYSSYTEEVGGTFSASMNVPAGVNIEATIYGGNFVGGILGYIGGYISYDDSYSNYVEVNVSGEPTSIEITSAYFDGGSSEYLDEEEAIIYVLSY